jgi:hypothetical protein
MIKQVIINSTSESILPCAKVKPNIQLRKLSASLVPMKSHFFCIKIYSSNQLLVGSVVIDVAVGREDHGSIPTTEIGRGLNHLMPKLTSEAD